MKIKHILSISLLYVFLCFAHSQNIKKPTLMILPSDNWCNQRYFTQSFQDQGRTIKVSDYQRAFQEDTEIGTVIGCIGQILTGKGFSLKDCEQEIKSLAVKSSEDLTITNSSGGMINETPLDVLKRKVKSDIIIQVNWQTKRVANGNSISFTLEAFDSYTNKRIATATGMREGNDGYLILLKESIADNIDEFDYQMNQWYQDVVTNGREISFKILCWDTWNKNLETEFNGTELMEVILQWMHNNTVNSSFNLSDATETFAKFEQVRIPIQDKNGLALDARGFASFLRKYLQNELQIPSKGIYRGLGESYVILGGK